MISQLIELKPQLLPKAVLFHIKINFFEFLSCFFYFTQNLYIFNIIAIKSFSGRCSRRHTLDVFDWDWDSGWPHQASVWIGVRCPCTHE